MPDDQKVNHIAGCVGSSKIPLSRFRAKGKMSRTFEIVKLLN